MSLRCPHVLPSLQHVALKQEHANQSHHQEAVASSQEGMVWSTGSAELGGNGLQAVGSTVWVLIGNPSCTTTNIWVTAYDQIFGFVRTFPLLSVELEVISHPQRHIGGLPSDVEMGGCGGGGRFGDIIIEEQRLLICC